MDTLFVYIINLYVFITTTACEKTMDIEENTSNASANEDNLKMLSLLDFAGQSAYYACHHIFFSPRAFYILVVDISKDLNSQADKACDQEGLIYSNWTYAGMQIKQQIIYDLFFYHF